MAVPLSNSLGKVSKWVQRKSEQVLPGKREKYLEGRREKFAGTRRKLISGIKRADLKGDSKRGIDLRSRLSKLERGAGSKLKVQSVGQVSTESTAARRAKYNNFKISLVEELKRLAGEGKRGSYDRVEERLLRLQSKAGSKFGDKELVPKGKIWEDRRNRRFTARQEGFVKAQKTISDSLRVAAESGDLARFRKIEGSLEKLKKSSKQLGLKVTVNPDEILKRHGSKGIKDELRAEAMVRSFLASRGKERGKIPGLSKISPNDDLNDIVLNSFLNPANKKVSDYHQWIGSISDSRHPTSIKSVRNWFFQGLRGSIEKGMGGAENFNNAIRALISFTRDDYTEVRDAQMGLSKSKDFLEKGKLIDRLLSREELIRPRIEKYRGIVVNSSTLEGMIKSASEKGTYSGMALSSWSSNIAVSKGFADNTLGEGMDRRVIYRTINKLGVPIDSISAIRTEYEVLTPSQANYRYLKYIKIKALDGDGKEQIYHVFDVEEM